MKYVIGLMFLLGACHSPPIVEEPKVHEPEPEAYNICDEEGEMLYIGKNVEECELTFFVCNSHEESYYNDFGCGCVTTGMYDCFGGPAE